jgi:hypothetical protein
VKRDYTSHLDENDVIFQLTDDELLKAVELVSSDYERFQTQYGCSSYALARFMIDAQQEIKDRGLE